MIPLIMTKKDARMRRLFPLLTVLAALAAPCGPAQALDQAKIDSVKKASDSFVTLAKDSFKTGKPPRLADPAAKPLLETLFNTKDIEGKPQPWSDVNKLHEWTVALTKVGVIYYLAGTGTDNPSVVAGDPKMTQRANQNSLTYAAEFGRYYDTQLRLYSAMIDSATAQMKAATPEERRDVQFRTLLNNISDGTANAMTGVLHTLALEGLPDDWLLLRTVALLDIAPKAAKFMAPDDRSQMKNAAAEAAELIKNPDVKSGVNTIARAFEMIQ
jgi:hypothetical protein